MEGNSIKRKVLMGTCGWSDPSLLQCGRFYPSSVRSAEDRLVHYCAHWPCVEVDTTTYAIPTATQTSKWVAAVKASTPGFYFHVKAFGLFCSGYVTLASLPLEVRSTIDQLPQQQQQQQQQSHVSGESSSGGNSSGGGRNSGGGSGDQAAQRATLTSLGGERVAKVWELFHQALQPMKISGTLGMVLFQFHLGFAPCEENKRHVLWCRKCLDPTITMAVEFRDRKWFVGGGGGSSAATSKLNDSGGADASAAPAPAAAPAGGASNCGGALERLSVWLAEAGIVLVAADELRHETFQKDRAQSGLPPGATREVLPIALSLTNPTAGLYVRVHRRHGKNDERVLGPSEQKEWASRIASVLLLADGPNDNNKNNLPSQVSSSSSSSSSSSFSTPASSLSSLSSSSSLSSNKDIDNNNNNNSDVNMSSFLRASEVSHNNGNLLLSSGSRSGDNGNGDDVRAGGDAADSGGSSSTTSCSGVPDALLQGPVWFLWGTDWEDSPLVNGKALTNSMFDFAEDVSDDFSNDFSAEYWEDEKGEGNGEGRTKQAVVLKEAVYDWRLARKAAAPLRRGSLLAMFKKQKQQQAPSLISPSLSTPSSSSSLLSSSSQSQVSPQTSPASLSSPFQMPLHGKQQQRQQSFAVKNAGSRGFGSVVNEGRGSFHKASPACGRGGGNASVVEAVAFASYFQKRERPPLDDIDDCNHVDDDDGGGGGGGGGGSDNDGISGSPTNGLPGHEHDTMNTACSSMAAARDDDGYSWGQLNTDPSVKCLRLGWRAGSGGDSDDDDFFGDEGSERDQGGKRDDVDDDDDNDEEGEEENEHAGLSLLGL